MTGKDNGVKEENNPVQRVRVRDPSALGGDWQMCYEGWRRRRFWCCHDNVGVSHDFLMGISLEADPSTSCPLPICGTTWSLNLPESQLDSLKKPFDAGTAGMLQLCVQIRCLGEAGFKSIHSALEIGRREACNEHGDWPSVMLCVLPVLWFWQDSGSGVFDDLAQPSGLPHDNKLHLELHSHGFTSEIASG